MIERPRTPAQRWVDRGVLAGGVLLFVTPAVSVFLWMLSLAFKNEVDNLAYPPVFIPSPPTLANFAAVFRENNFLLYFWNSIVVTGVSTAVALLIGVPAGYAIARLKAKKLLLVILIARMTPAKALVSTNASASLIDGAAGRRPGDDNSAMIRSITGTIRLPPREREYSITSL